MGLPIRIVRTLLTTEKNTMASQKKHTGERAYNSRLDSRNRIVLKLTSHEVEAHPIYSVTHQENGQIILSPRMIVDPNDLPSEVIERIRKSKAEISRGDSIEYL